jgi:DnaJ-class molecular chaperone
MPPDKTQTLHYAGPFITHVYVADECKVCHGIGTVDAGGFPLTCTKCDGTGVRCMRWVPLTTLKRLMDTPCDGRIPGVSDAPE